jgi:hypothetical protein
MRPVTDPTSAARTSNGGCSARPAIIPARVPWPPAPPPPPSPLFGAGPHSSLFPRTGSQRDGPRAGTRMGPRDSAAFPAPVARPPPNADARPTGSDHHPFWHHSETACGPAPRFAALCSVDVENWRITDATPCRIVLESGLLLLLSTLRSATPNPLVPRHHAHRLTSS